VKKKIVAVGLPNTGKTTFLAALWETVNAHDVDSQLKLHTLKGDAHHLNDIRDLWADCKPIPRTHVKDECVVSMVLHGASLPGQAELMFTDLSGESFEKQWTERVWTSQYAEFAESATGFLLFVHPRECKESPLIRDTLALRRAIASDAAGTGTALPEVTPVPPDTSHASTQVQLVELLQFLKSSRPLSSTTPIAVVVSAWDLVRSLSAKMTPDAWLRQALPLLWQYLRANPELFASKVYGVSAQGGDLTGATELRKCQRPADRIVIVHGTDEGKDITRPIGWLLSGETQ
jgi:hypothetical protein